MSGSRICCCGGFTGCAICSTPDSFLGLPPPYEWCNIEYEFTFGVGELLLPEIKSNYTFTDFLLTTEPSPGVSPCDCDNTIFPSPWPISKGLTLFYDINILKNNNGNIIDANTIGCTYDNRDIFNYDLESRDVLAKINKIDMHPSECPTTYYDPSTGILYNCGDQYVPRDIEAFIAPLYGITQHNNAAFSCQFTACGKRLRAQAGSFIIEQIFLPSSLTCEPYDLISDVGCLTSGFAVGVTFFEADSYVLKEIKYFPVVRTIDKTIPIPTPNCFYELEESNIIGSVNRPTPVIKTCYVPSVEEECRCQSGLIVEITGRAEQQFKVLVFEEEQIVGQGGELQGNRNFIAIGTTMSTQANTGNFQPAQPIGQCKIRLYYFGCIDDIIYGIPSPTERVFILDAGTFTYDGVYRNNAPNNTPLRVYNKTDINLEFLPQFESCPNRPVNCIPNSFTNKGIVLPASFFLGLGLPNEIIIKRLS